MNTTKLSLTLYQHSNGRYFPCVHINGELLGIVQRVLLVQNLLDPHPTIEIDQIIATREMESNIPKFKNIPHLTFNPTYVDEDGNTTTKDKAHFIDVTPTLPANAERVAIKDVWLEKPER